jgi:hypothetical protein
MTTRHAKSRHRLTRRRTRGPARRRAEHRKWQSDLRRLTAVATAATNAAVALGRFHTALTILGQTRWAHPDLVDRVLTARSDRDRVFVHDVAGILTGRAKGSLDSAPETDPTSPSVTNAC